MTMVPEFCTRCEGIIKTSVTSRERFRYGDGLAGLDGVRSAFDWQRDAGFTLLSMLHDYIWRTEPDAILCHNSENASAL